MAYEYGVYDPLALHYSNEALLFDGRSVTPGEDGVPGDGTLFSQVITMPIAHIGMNLKILSSADGALTIEEYVNPAHDPNMEGYLNSKFQKFESSVAVTADTAVKEDYDTTFTAFRVKFVPDFGMDPPAPYTLLVEAKRKG